MVSPFGFPSLMIDVMLKVIEEIVVTCTLSVNLATQVDCTAPRF